MVMASGQQVPAPGAAWTMKRVTWPALSPFTSGDRPSADGDKRMGGVSQ